MAKKAASGKTSVVAKPASHAKAPSRAQLETQIKTLQTAVRSLKHQGTKKHKAAATKKHTAKRGWSPDESVAVCSARAVAESLRIATGQRVADEDVLALHRSAGGDPDAGESIWCALRAAADFGVAGRKPLSYAPVAADTGTLIVGVRLPDGQPHTVALDVDRWEWWSWGEQFDPAGCRIAEIWAVTW